MIVYSQFYFFKMSSQEFFSNRSDFLNSSGKDLLEAVIFYVICIFILSIIVYVLYQTALKTITKCGRAYEQFKLKEGMSPQTRWNRSARYLNSYNGLLASDKQNTKSNAPIPTDINPRGNHVFKWLLKESEDKTQTNQSPDSIYAAGLDARPLVPDFSVLPVVSQNGVVENAEKAKNYTNSRLEPPQISDLNLSVHKNTEGGLSTDVEGFKRRRKH
jgi:hypothetical protein